MIARAALITVALALALAPAAAGADDICADPIDEPVAVPWRDAGFDGGRGGCLQPDASVDVRGRALIDTPAFYGTLGGDLTVAVRLVEQRRFEWGLAVRAAEVAFIQNAVWKIVEPTYGPLLVHGAFGAEAALAGRPLRVAVVAQAELPYTRSTIASSTGAVQLAAVVTWQARARLRIHARAAALGWYGRAVTGTSTRAAGLASLDASWRARRWLSADLGVDVQGGWYGLGLDHVAARVGAHWRVIGPWRVAIAVGVPLVGAERQDVAASLGVRRDLD
ncbi:MAG: hypothetical protein IPL61_40625 [Myxococcales bacterium]|nr:hypothetical protein [Myxococcales bacterium]